MTKDPGHRERATDLGIVRISNEAISAIAQTAAMEVSGVHKMGGGFTKTLYEIFFNKVASKGVRIQMTDSEVKLAISIVVEYGMDITRIADEVQENVKRAVEKMAGLVISAVDVVVEGVHTQGLTEKQKTLKQ